MTITWQLLEFTLSFHLVDLSQIIICVKPNTTSYTGAIFKCLERYLNFLQLHTYTVYVQSQLHNVLYVYLTSSEIESFNKEPK